VYVGSDVNKGAVPMIPASHFVNSITVVAAYVALAFVGAIVLGVF
jgi:hypothetical protein